MVASIVCPPEEARRYVDAGYLVFEEPARAVRALAALRQIADAFDRPARTVDVPAEMPRIAAGTSFNEASAKALLGKIGVASPVERVVASPDDVDATARNKNGRPH